MKQEDENELTSACLRLEYTDENPINIQSAIPITDEEGKTLSPYEFTLTNMCKTNATFEVNLEILDTTTFDDLDYIKFMFNEKKPVILTTNELAEKTLDNAIKSYNLKQGYIGKDESLTYTLRLWMDSQTPALEKYMEKTLKSKVTIVATSYPKELDKTPPVVNFKITEVENGFLIDAKYSTDENKIALYYYSKDGKNFIESTKDNYIIKDNKEIQYGNATDVIKNLANSYVSNIYVKAEDVFGNISDAVVRNVRLESLMYDNTSDNNLRYVGNNPNNYVSFNNELWRIVGVMNNIDDGNNVLESRIKIMRSTISKGVLTSNTNISNNWNTVALKDTLNGAYFNSILDNSRLMIEDAVWYLGGTPADVYKPNYRPSDVYNYERGTLFNYGQWTGKIALIYPSDAMYATDGGSISGREYCMNTPIWYDNRLTINCAPYSWIWSMVYDSGFGMWTITPYRYVNNLNNFMHIMPYRGYTVSPGAASVYNTRYQHAYVPTIYLKGSVKIISGTGTTTDPFILSI